jgi:hypothetical protein
MSAQAIERLFLEEQLIYLGKVAMRGEVPHHTTDDLLANAECRYLVEHLAQDLGLLVEAPQAL